MQTERIRGTFVGMVVVVSLLLSSGNCAFIFRPVDARITYFMPPSGIYYPDQVVVSYFRLKNAGREARTFWVDYGVRDQAEQWYGIASYSMALNPGEESLTQRALWRVPEASSCLTGYYTTVLVISDAQSQSKKAALLTHQEQPNSFQVLRLFEHFDHFDPNLWYLSSHQLGKSYLDPNNVDIGSGYARIRIPAGTLTSGELASVDYFKYGTYRASISVVAVSGCVTGFFLWESGGDEIDIEIYNDGNWQLEFVTWVQGNKTNYVKRTLNFDPSAGYHEYRIDFYPEEVSFFVDGQCWQRFTSRLPSKEMRLLVNSWFPTWLPGMPPATDKYTYVDWIQY